MNAYLHVALDLAVAHGATGDLADLGDLEDVDDFGPTLVVLAVNRIEKSEHGLGHLVLQLVDDRVQADFNVFAIGKILRLLFRLDVEPDDDGVRCRGQKDVRFGDGTDAGMQDLDAHLLGGHAYEHIGQHFDRALHIALEDEIEVLDAGELDLLGEAFERNPRALGELSFALLEFAVLRDALGLVAIGNHQDTVSPASGMPSSPRISTGVEGHGLLRDGATAVIEHGAYLAEGVAHDEAVTGAQRYRSEPAP